MRLTSIVLWGCSLVSGCSILAQANPAQALTASMLTSIPEVVECPEGTRYRNSGCQPISFEEDDKDGTSYSSELLVASDEGWSDTPTIPGDGTPQRTQGSSTRMRRVLPREYTARIYIGRTTIIV